jgi:hypothetical protein
LTLFPKLQVSVSSYRVFNVRAYARLSTFRRSRKKSDDVFARSISQEKDANNEEAKVAKLTADEDAFVGQQIDQLTADAMNAHEKQLALVIGRLLTRQARKLATPSASLDPTTVKIQVKLICFCILFAKHL